MSTELVVFVGMILSAALYSLHFCVFATTIYFVHRNCGKRALKTPVWMYACVWVMFMLGTMNVVGNVGFQRKVWIYNMHTQQNTSEWGYKNRGDLFNVLTKAGIAPSFWIQNAVLCHRLYAVYCTSKHRNKLVVASLVGLAATVAVWAIGVQRLFLPTSEHRLVSDVVITIIHCTVSESLNLSMTAAIIWRMLSKRRYIAKVLGPSHAKMYTSITAIFIESGAIFSILMVGCNVQLRRKLGVGFESIAYAILGQATGICTDLIIFRVALGRAWSSKTLTEATLHAGSPDQKGDAHVVVTRDIHMTW